eukprot:GHVR01109074.1.p1 GENE.GHVR01109074.1~~GHVR01109074.1.p1  ORF type:complete len:217 (+),score=18.82 GHVR01109074.1:39-689(+)
MNRSMNFNQLLQIIRKDREHDAKNLEQEFLYIAKKFQQNEQDQQYLDDLKIQQRVHDVEQVSKLTTEELRNVSARFFRMSEFEEELRRNQEQVRVAVEEAKATKRRVIPSDHSTLAMGSVSIPSPEFRTVVQEMKVQKDDIEHRMCELEEVVSCYQRSRSSDGEGSADQFAMIEDTLKLQYDEYRRLALRIAQLRERMQQLQNSAAKSDLRGHTQF